jgi:hypothetical protein
MGEACKTINQITKKKKGMYEYIAFNARMFKNNSLECFHARQEEWS